MFNHGGAWWKLATLSPDNAIERVVHGCDVLNKRGFARPYVLSEHTLVYMYSKHVHVVHLHKQNGMHAHAQNAELLAVARSVRHEVRLSDT